MDRREILLKEYETCQGHNNSVASQYWAIFAVFVPVNAVILGWIVNSVISNGLALSADTKWLVPVLGIGMIAIIMCLWLYFDRVNFIISINYYRMRQIEEELGMRKNWWVDILDHRNKIPASERTLFANLLNTYPSRPWWRLWAKTPYTPPTGRSSMKVIFLVIITLWLVLIITSFILANC